MNDEFRQAQPSGMDIGDVYYIVFRHKWKIGVFFVAGVLAAAYLYFLKPPVYQSKAKLLVRYVLEREGKSLSPSAPNSEIKTPDSAGANIINAEMEILNSFDLAAQVADLIGPEKILAKVGGGTDRSEAAALIEHNLVTEAPGKSSVITVVFAHPDPELVQPVLRQIITNYLDQHFKIHRAPGVFDDFLAKKAEELRLDLKETEDKLIELKKQAGVVSVEDTKRAYADQISKISLELVSAEAERAAQQAALEEPKQPALLNSFSNPVVTEQKVSLEKVEEYKNLSLRLDSFRKRENDYLTVGGYAETSTPVKSVREQITGLESQKRKLEEAYPQLTKLILPPGNGASQSAPSGQIIDSTFEASRKVAGLEAKIRFLTRQLKEIRNEAAKVDAAEPEITRLQRQKELLEANYHYYQTSLQQSQADETLGAGKFSNIGVVQEPCPPAKDTKTTGKFAAIALAFGLFGGIGLAFFIELVLDRSVRRPEEIRKRLHLPLFLAIPHLSRNGRASLPGRRNDVGPAAGQERPENQTGSGAAAQPTKTLGQQITGEVAHWETRHGLRAYYEALRDRLITHFEINNMTHKPKLVAVTSCSRGAGVTSAATGLAATLSETGDGNVLLVDMNFGQGAAHPFYKGKSACALSEVLESGKRNPALISENLYLASLNGTAGKLPRVFSNRFTNLIPKLKMSDYDYVIFDMPAISQTSITLRVAAFMDLVLLVIESGKTNRDVVEQANSILAESHVGAKAVLNKYRRYVPHCLQQEL